MPSISKAWSRAWTHTALFTEWPVMHAVCRVHKTVGNFYSRCIWWQLGYSLVIFLYKRSTNKNSDLVNVPLCSSVINTDETQRWGQAHINKAVPCLLNFQDFSEHHHPELFLWQLSFIPLSSQPSDTGRRRRRRGRTRRRRRRRRRKKR